ADRTPAACGVNVTEIVQLAPAATLLPQQIGRASCRARVPVTATPVIDKAALPGFDKVIVCAALAFPRFWLPNDTVEGLTEACGTVTPLPFSAALGGDPAAVSVIATEADRTPAACGVNVTEIVQLPPAATLLPQ